MGWNSYGLFRALQCHLELKLKLKLIYIVTCVQGRQGLRGRKGADGVSVKGEKGEPGETSAGQGGGVFIPGPKGSKVCHNSTAVSVSFLRCSVGVG